MAKSSTAKSDAKTAKQTTTQKVSSQEQGKQQNSSQNNSQMSKDEQVGFHKGSLSTLIKERQELLRMVSIVEQLIQMHTGALNDLGISQEEPKQAKATEVKKTRIPIDELI